METEEREAGNLVSVGGRDDAVIDMETCWREINCGKDFNKHLLPYLLIQKCSIIFLE